MHAVAKKLVLVLSMLAVITAQLFNADFAMPMNHSGSVAATEISHVSMSVGDEAADHLTHAPEHRSTAAHLAVHPPSHLANHTPNTMLASVGVEVGSGCCDQDTQSMSHCGDSGKSSHSCDNHADCAQSSCAQSHCVSSVGCGLSHYFLDIDASLAVSFSVSHLLLPQNSVSLYRPPIFR